LPRHQTPYFCPYCGRYLLHLPAPSVSESTREHVVPEAIGGSNKWVVRVCRECNASASKRCDAAFATVSDFYRFLAYEPFVRRGVITTMTGESIPGSFKIRVHRDNRIEWLWGRGHGANGAIPRKLVSHVTFLAVDAGDRDTRHAVQAIAYKVALGGVFLALRRHNRSAADALYGGVHLFALRSKVVKRTLVQVEGTAASVDVRRMQPSEVASWLDVREDQPIEREHRVSVDGTGAEVRVRIALFTELCVEVTLKPALSLSFDSCTVRQALPGLLPATVATAGNMLLSRPSASICMVITDRGQPIVPASEDMVRAALSGSLR
jgi:HNH endonuclease